MKKLLVSSLLLCHVFIAAGDGNSGAGVYPDSGYEDYSSAGSSSSSRSAGVESDSPHSHEDGESPHSGGGGMQKPIHSVHFHGQSSVFPNATYRHEEPSTKNIVYSGTARVVQSPDNSPSAILGEAAKTGASMLVQFIVRDAYEGIKNMVFTNEEKEMQLAVQNIQLRQANQQLDAEAENLEFMKEIRENIAIIRMLNKKESNSELTEKEKKQREHAIRSLSLMQQLLNPKVSPAA